MRDSVYAGTLRRFVNGTEGIAQRLEFADELGGDRWPMSGDIVSLRRLLDDLRAAAVYRGRTGASDYRLAAQVVEQLVAVVEAHDAGDLAPWRSCRGSVLESVASLRQHCQPEHDELVVRSAVPAAPAPRQAMPAPISQEQEQGENSHKGEKVSAKTEDLPRNGTKIVTMLWEHNALSAADKVTRAYVSEATRLSESIVRRAIETQLTPRGLLLSKSGRDGGLWLSPAGIETAGRLAAK